jgi:lariat debranching enzyme
MGNLKPQWWFSAHLHVRFEATVVHPPPGGAPPVKIANPDEIVMDDDEFEETTPAVVPAEPEQVAPPRFNPDEILLEDEEEEVVVPPLPPVQRVTNFLALDKCLPKRDYLEVIDIPTTISSPDPDSPPRFTYDIEWLGVTRAFHPYLSLTREQTPLPALEKAKELVKNEVEWVKQRFDGKAPLVESVQVFSMTAPGPDLSKEKKGRYLDRAFRDWIFFSPFLHADSFLLGQRYRTIIRKRRRSVRCWIFETRSMSLRILRPSPTIR